MTWIDSTITPSWLSTEPYRWQSFVSNRVSNIQTTNLAVKWYRVPRTVNPTDLGTRSLLLSKLVINDLYLCSPDWLNHPLNEISEFNISDSLSLPDSFERKERKLIPCVTKVIL